MTENVVMRLIVGGAGAIAIIGGAIFMIAGFSLLWKAIAGYGTWPQ